MTRFATLLLIILVTGCVSQPVGLHTPAEILGTASHWSMKGKLGLRSPEENLSLGVWWSQAGDVYEIDFRGAMAMGSGRITGDPARGIRLEANGDKPVYGQTPEQLVERLTGVSVPVTPMKYWVRGRPSPESPYESAADGFRQMGWLVETTLDPRGLPKRIILTREAVRLKLVVKSWGY